MGINYHRTLLVLSVLAVIIWLADAAVRILPDFVTLHFIPDISVELSEGEAAGAPTLSTSANVVFVGPPEVVFDHSTQRCNIRDIPDMPARAFRAADGKINLLSRQSVTISEKNHTNRRMVGDSLDTVRNDCSTIMQSSSDPDFFDFNYHEWLASPYTLDGNTTYALNHEEWYSFLADPECKPEERAHGWVNAITLAVSKDGGATYSEPTDYIVRYPPTEWNTSFGCTAKDRTLYGSFEPSNIIKKDNYYYAMFWWINDPGKQPKRGECLMRTQNLADASSWEVYTSDGFAKSKTAECQPVFPAVMAATSLTYNTYLNAYVITGLRWREKDFAFAVSQDLITWSAPKKIMDAPPLQDWWKRAYPSLLDTKSSSSNFETGGQELYLYHTENNGGFDRDLVRHKVRLSLSSLTTTTYQASADFSGTQGGNNWYYTNSLGNDMVFDVAKNRWQGSEQFLLLTANGGHPGNGADAVRRWVVPQSGTVAITGSARDNDTRGGDGVVVSMKKDSIVLWEQTIENGDTTGVTFNLSSSVTGGEVIDFIISKRSGSGWDSTYFDPKIVFTPK